MHPSIEPVWPVEVPFEGFVDTVSNLEVKFIPKTPQRGVNTHFEAKPRKIATVSKRQIGYAQNLMMKSNMAAAAILHFR